MTQESDKLCRSDQALHAEEQHFKYVSVYTCVCLQVHMHVCMCACVYSISHYRIITL